MSDDPLREQRQELLEGVVRTLLDDLRNGAGDKDKRRQVEEWMRSVGEKYPEFHVETGLRDYYLAEAQRLRADFNNATELVEKLVLGRNIETFLDRASDYDRRSGEKK